MNTVEKIFKDKAVNQPGGWSIYSKTDSVNFVNECKKENITIIGIDAFYIRNNGIEPSLENSIDFSGKILQEKYTIDDVIHFLEERDDSLYFEICCK